MTPAFFRRFVPELAPIGPRERMRSALGALVGILATGLLSRAALGDGSALPIMIAPMGASAVLLFAAPASPLAQPWSILGGNLVAALVGVTATKLIPDPYLACALAIGVAIALMTALKCLHPPSGAVALTAVLGGPAVTTLGYGFVVWPVLANSALLLGCALAYNNLTGRAYPHPRAQGVSPRPVEPARSASEALASADIDAALENFGQLLDVERSDLEAILRDAQLRSYARRSGLTTCGEIMTRDVVAVGPHAPLKEALELLRRHRVKALPVTDESGRVLGVVTQTDLLDKSEWSALGPRLGFRRRVRLALTRVRAPHGAVEDIMTASPVTARPETPVADVVAEMARSSLHHLPVVDGDGKLLGMVSQADIVSALLADGAQASEVAA